MKPRTEEFLNFLLWSAEKLTRPTFRNLTDSYEGWAYRNGLLRQAEVLEGQRLLECPATATGDRLYRLTWQGRLRALGGRDPQTRWSREWDGRWQLVVFDVPVARNSQRARLRRHLRDEGFGCLQNSVWIAPDLSVEERQVLLDGKVNVKSLMLLEARAGGGESNADIVAGAWDFELINRHYARLLEILGQRPTGPLGSQAAAKELLRWASVERAAWLAAVKFDPLLPEKILPPNYLGQRAWQRRVEVLREAGRQLPTFKP